ncbi:TetR/AcrR family transcriptional regulator [Cellulomonas humilata]|uniref:AcrR family transcriptional regulator n=1 Tax=Cellulomonas humilata TaxID=144055 RepID=A0ABU0EG73_9CELL|nr:TetR/AcrR family transcriptional regulator [Cellulomonas humilata]MDQ0374279.1 AcrR family transcriptional regulator [Cellulomonas humilata]
MQNSVVDEPALGLRERKKRARREALIDATHRLVAEHGLDAVTVEAICEEAGVSARTFFNYFETKDDAVLGHTPWPLDSDAAETFATGGPTGHLLADLQTLVTSFLTDAPIGRQRLTRALELAAKEPRLLARHLAWMEQHKGQLSALVERRLGEDAPYSSEIVGATLLFLTHATFMRWDAAGGTGSADEHITAVVADLRSILAD